MQDGRSYLQAARSQHRVVHTEEHAEEPTEEEQEQRAAWLEELPCDVLEMINCHGYFQNLYGTGGQRRWSVGELCDYAFGVIEEQAGGLPDGSALWKCDRRVLAEETAAKITEMITSRKKG